MNEASDHSAADVERLEVAELCNTGEGLVYSVEQTLTEYGEHLAENEQEEVRESLGRARQALEGKDSAELRQAVEDLQEIAYRMTEAMYERLSQDES